MYQARKLNSDVYVMIMHVSVLIWPLFQRFYY